VENQNQNLQDNHIAYFAPKILWIIIGILLLVLVVSASQLWQTKNDQIKNLSLAATPIHRTMKADTIQMVDTSTWKTYTNSYYGFSFEYPKEWTAEKILETEGVNLISPLLQKSLDEEDKAGGEGDVPPNDIGIYIRDNPDNIHVERFVKTYDNGWFENYKSQKNITVGNRSAIQFSDQGIDVNHFPLIATFVQGTDKIIVINIQYGDDQMLNIYNQILSTFKFTK
jgi:hypothetical protein